VVHRQQNSFHTNFHEHVPVGVILMTKNQRMERHNSGTALNIHWPRVALLQQYTYMIQLAEYYIFQYHYQSPAFTALIFLTIFKNVYNQNQGNLNENYSVFCL
jgi:hypothetical protein